MILQKNILLVEDDKDDQDFFIEALNKIENTHLFFVAGNGKEAIDKLHNCTTLPDIIFTDINMPVMNGIECLSALRNNPLTKDIPVVFLSSEIVRTELIFKLGARAFIKKSASGKMLQGQLEQMINQTYLPLLSSPTSVC